MLIPAAVALVSWSAISIVWAESSSAVVANTQRYLLNVLLLPIVFVAIRDRKQLVTIVAAFVFGATASAAYGLLQSTAPFGRLAGTIGDPNEQAAVLVAAIMLAVSLAAFRGRGSTKRLWTIGAVTLCSIGLVNTASRGGLVALAFALLAGIVFGGRWRPRVAGLAVVGLCGTLLYLTVLAPLSTQKHLNSTSSTGRTDLWRVGLKMFVANPITGVGAGNFPVSSVHYVQKAGPLSRADLIVNVPHVTHNQYLDVLDELGIPGLCAFVLVMLASLTAAVRAARRFEREGDRPLELLSRLLVLAILGLLAADVFLSGQYSKQLWLLLALPAPLLALPLRAQSEHGLRPAAGVVHDRPRRRRRRRRTVRHGLGDEHAARSSRAVGLLDTRRRRACDPGVRRRRNSARQPWT